MRIVRLALCVFAGAAAADPPPSNTRSHVLDADGIAQSLTDKDGDAANGALLVQQRHKSLCVLCHAGPFPDPHLQGTIAPDLTGIGSRLSAAQLRLRVVDMKRLNPNSIMPSYGVTAHGEDARIAREWRDKPILSAQEIEDLVAYLATLKQ
jgi:L-cysteine S-thiosulfotransferase